MISIESVIVYPSVESIVWKSINQVWQFVSVHKLAYWGTGDSRFVWGDEVLEIRVTRADCEQLVKGYVGKVNNRWVKVIPSALPVIGSVCDWGNDD